MSRIDSCLVSTHTTVVSAWPCVCARVVGRSPHHAKHKPEESGAPSTSQTISSHHKWHIGFRTLPQSHAPRNTMMARANIWVRFRTIEDPMKLFRIHEEAINTKHLLPTIYRHPDGGRIHETLLVHWRNAIVIKMTKESNGINVYKRSLITLNSIDHSYKPRFCFNRLR